MSLTRPDSPTVRRTVAAYAELVRVPNLFTAPPDVILGAALVVAADAVVSLRATAGLALGSVLLYAGGTTLNDYFDAPVDADERPERPIPSGRVSRSGALRFGLALLGGGVTVAFVAAGVGGGAVAGVLAIAILSYDGLLKGGPAGFLAMGSTRGLNVLLGTTAAGVAPTELPGWALTVPVVVAGYIAAVTYMAAEEATGVDRRTVVVAGIGVVAATVSALALIWVVSPGSPLVGVQAVEMEGVGAALAGTVVAGGFLAWTGRALAGAYRNPAPEVVGPAVGTCVVALVLLDAAFASVAGVSWAVGTVLFLGPAIGLSRVFDVS